MLQGFLATAVLTSLPLAAILTRHGRAVGALRVSEERFRLMVDSVVDLRNLHARSVGHVASWNAGAERIKGYTANEIIGRHFSCFYPPEDVARGVPQQALAMAAETGRFEAETWRLRKGRHPLLGECRDRRGARPGWCADRLCQGVARHH
ncbi:MAG: PAS domain S-box protein [Aliidongia sp.]